MNAARSVVCRSAASLCSIDGATHSTLWSNKCSKTKHCISKSTFGSSTILKPSNMPVRGGSSSRYSIVNPYFTIRAVAFRHKFTSGCDGMHPTKRCPTNSCPEIVGAVLSSRVRDARSRTVSSIMVYSKTTKSCLPSEGRLGPRPGASSALRCMMSYAVNSQSNSVTLACSFGSNSGSTSCIKATSRASWAI